MKNICFEIKKPSCGTDVIYCENFNSNKLVKCKEITTKVLKIAGIKVHNENNFDEILKK